MFMSKHAGKFMTLFEDKNSKQKIVLSIFHNVFFNMHLGIDLENIILNWFESILYNKQIKLIATQVQINYYT